jgi:hypothetical protein
MIGKILGQRGEKIAGIGFFDIVNKRLNTLEGKGK